MASFRLALLQLAITKNKNENLQTAAKLITEAAKNGAKIISLPEIFNSPYGTQYFANYAESIPGESTDLLASQAKQNGVYIIGGSVPECDGEKLYNTCTVFNPEGNMIAKHRKVHLFDIDIPGKITVKESDVLSAGNMFTTFNTPFCKVGVGICFDIRFAEMASIYANQGCSLLIYPGAFNMVTGPAHWSLLCRARAVDNLLYVATVSPARNEEDSYVAWGHSMVANPWGEVLGELDHSPGILYADIEPNYVQEIRKQIPVFSGKRKDLYNNEKIK